MRVGAGALQQLAQFGDTTLLGRLRKKQGLDEMQMVGEIVAGVLVGPSAFGFDAVVEFPPHGFHAYRLNAQMEITNPEFRGMVFNYRHQVIQSLDETPCDYATFRCVRPVE